LSENCALRRHQQLSSAATPANECQQVFLTDRDAIIPGERAKEEGDEPAGMNGPADAEKKSSSPKWALPKKRLAFVDEGGGGGFWRSEAVGARDWRMEYVRCILGVCGEGHQASRSQEFSRFLKRRRCSKRSSEVRTEA
jgi:hypothetical protein